MHSKKVERVANSVQTKINVMVCYVERSAERLGSIKGDNLNLLEDESEKCNYVEKHI